MEKGSISKTVVPSKRAQNTQFNSSEIKEREKLTFFNENFSTALVRTTRIVKWYLLQ